MNRIKELREEKKIGAEDLANRLGISVRYLYGLERGDRRLNEDLINGLCDALEVDAEYLLCRADTRQVVKNQVLEYRLEDEDVKEAVITLKKLRAQGMTLDDLNDVIAGHLQLLKRMEERRKKEENN